MGADVVDAERSTIVLVTIVVNPAGYRLVDSANLCIASLVGSGSDLHRRHSLKFHMLRVLICSRNRNLNLHIHILLLVTFIVEDSQSIHRGCHLQILTARLSMENPP